MFRKKITILVLFLLSKAYGQVTGNVFVLNKDRDLFYVNYTPELNNNSTFNYEGLSAKLGFKPIRLKKLMFVNTIGIDKHRITFKNNKPSFLKTKENYYNANYSLLSKYQISKNWSVNALLMPHLIGNFNDKINTDNLKFNGILFAEKRFNTKNKDTYFVVSFGIGYLTLSGNTKVNPSINVLGSINNKISFAIGLPSAYLKYDFNKRHAIKLVGDVNDFNVKISNTSLLNSNKVNSAVFTTASVGLEYNYWLTNNIGVMVKGTHSLHEKYDFNNVNDELLLGIDVPLKTYLTFGIKINPFR